MASMLRLNLIMGLLLFSILFALLPLKCFAIGNGFEEGGSSLSSSADSNPQLEASPMGEAGTEHYVSILNARLKDWNLDRRPIAHGSRLQPQVVHNSVKAVRSQLLSQRGQRSLLYLGMTPDNKRKVHAVFLDHDGRDFPNVAIVSTPRKWKSLSEKMQLHTFATVQKQDPAHFHHGLNHDFNASELDSFIKHIVPKTSQSEFDNLLPRFPHPAFRPYP